ncbi:MAG: hypothetical protein HQ567_31195, partial [Candidatus Nealsonbacteria bacterium]|nr:hypothetical protein [Candidatus Nealsonbacteria bacterium]
LWEDYLDGAPFHHSDTKTTTQLLGNLVLVSLRETRLSYQRRRWKRLRRLDLANTRATLRGPYLWFHFISRSIAQQTAKLVVDYNAHALPLNRAATADDCQIRRYVRWLAQRMHEPIERVELPDAFRTRWDALAEDEHDAADEKPNRRPRDFHANDFTAIHFLSADDDVEADVRRRYGDAVARLMRRDRRDNVRRVFRTFPLHRWPKEQRTFNPLAVYDRYFAGGRVLLLPLRAVWWTGVLAFRAVRQLGRFVRDVLYPNIGDLDALTEPDPYAVAVRKIHRMRKPVFMECLRMRARFDPEYLGAWKSADQGTGQPDHPAVAPIEEDLATIGADPGQVHEFRQLTAERRRQMTDFRRLLATMDREVCRPEVGEPFSAESLRAMAIAYTIDYRDVRSHVEATERLRRALDEIATNGTTSSDAAPGLIRTPRAWWCRLRHAGKARRLFSQPALADFDAAARRASTREIYGRRGELLAALRTLAGKHGPDDPVDAARTTLLSVARDPATWSRQLVTLRAVQTLSVLDLRTYCDLVADLGEYETCPPETTETL